ncbi:MAG: DUF6090 family protein [Balneolaceae bacterium]
MLKFFRKIRQQLLEENRFTKYLMYAAGEILLVVIGILIALQINNWNESKKTGAEVESLLIALKTDLEQDTLLIKQQLPFIIEQFDHNESLRARVASETATEDTLLKIMRFEFNPNWSVQVVYNTNAVNSLMQSGLIEQIPNPLNSDIKNFYNRKSTLMARVDQTTNDYREKITSHVNTYTFGSTAIHDQGPLIDSLVWDEVDYSHLAASFQGISNFKRILFTETRQELNYSLLNSRRLLRIIDIYLNQ